jgi:hypothetical protein
VIGLHGTSLNAACGVACAPSGSLASTLAGPAGLVAPLGYGLL